MTFKVGDKVIRRKEHSTLYFNPGQVYTISEISVNMMRLKGVAGAWSNKKFDLVRHDNANRFIVKNPKNSPKEQL